MYREEFITALERTRKFGLFTPPLAELDTERLLTDRAQGDLALIVNEHFADRYVSDIALQCLSINLQLRDILSDYFGKEVYYTIGDIGLENRRMYEQTEDSLLSMLENGAPGPSINLHAWITLPSMEIIDITFPTSYGQVNDIKEMIGATVALHPSELTGGMSYHPMIIGEEFLYRLGALHVIATRPLNQQ